MDQVEQFIGAHPQPTGLGDHRLDTTRRELFAAVVEQLGPSAPSHEHRDARRFSRSPASSSTLIPFAAVAGLMR
ncbi:MAG: hypothetical protein J2P58_03845 [Acidimicrobiaceae bacterium]|nr:hypothetical protein [Acidimicrobiaceae bacterium]